MWYPHGCSYVHRYPIARKEVQEYFLERIGLESKTAMAISFDEQYQNIAWWVQDGVIEIGRGYLSDSFVRVIDEGGMVWESEKEYKPVAEALADADAAIAAWVKENGLL